MQGAEVEFRHVSKHYGGGEIGHNAVEDLSLVVPPGEICVLVGPSGCGKTTSLKMVNRLVEPTAGEVLIDGQDVAAAETTALRRRVGYVIQQIGLFPHQTIAENVATVPRLLDWPGRKIDARVDELLELVGLDPRRVRRRYPAQLSGGERQRVGVARALAAEPPVMLMDEPFGAVDPIVRARLQDEFLRIHQRLNTTVLFVTHDVDEAIKMGDRVAVMELGGRLAQFAPPSEILARPASEFVARFVGADRALKRLALVTVGAVQLQPLQALEADMPKVTPDTPLRDALAELIGAGARAALVVDSSGTPLGRLSLDAILAAAQTDPEDERDAAAV